MYVLHVYKQNTHSAANKISARITIMIPPATTNLLDI